MRIARILRLVNVTVHARLSLWLLIASSCLVSSPGLSQTLSGRDVALIDAMAALHFELEEGRAAPGGKDPVTKTSTGDSIVFRDKSIRYRSDRDDAQHVFVFRLPQPCVIAVEHQTRGSFSGEPRHLKVTHVFDLSRKHTLEFEKRDSTSGFVTLQGDRVMCSVDHQTCRNFVGRPIFLRGGAATGNPRDAEEFVARRKSAVDVIRKLCPGQPK